MKPDLFDQIRTACEEVAGAARHVRIDERTLSACATSLAGSEISKPSLDADTHYIGGEEETAAYFLTLDAVNFGSGYFPHLRKGHAMSGYFTIASSLKECCEVRGHLEADELAEIDALACAVMFEQDPRNEVVSELMEHFARALRDLGLLLLDRFEGGFGNLIRAAEGSALKLVGLLGQMPYFQDVEQYGDLRVPFYKRAQLTAADLALAFGGQGLGRFDDLDRLTMFADNLVPHVLRLDGVLVYEESLARRISKGELIPAGSAEEIEIRACALHAVERLAAEMGKRDRRIISMELDYLLWNRGQQPEYKAHPRHRTRTVYY